MDEERWQVTVAAFADSEQNRLAPAGVLTRYLAQPRAQFPTALELMRVAHRRDQRGRDQRSDAFDLGQSLDELR